MIQRILDLVEIETTKAVELSRQGNFVESGVHEEQARRLLNFIRVENSRR